MQAVTRGCVHWGTLQSRWSTIRTRLVGCVAALNPTTLVRVLGSRTRSRAFGTRRRATVLRWCTGRRRSTSGTCRHIEEGAAFSTSARITRSRAPSRARGMRWAAAAGSAWGGAARTRGDKGARATTRRRASATRRRGRGHKPADAFATSPRASLLYRWWGSRQTNFPTRPLFSIVVGKLEFGKGCNQRTFSNFPMSHSAV